MSNKSCLRITLVTRAASSAMEIPACVHTPHCTKGGLADDLSVSLPHGQNNLDLQQGQAPKERLNKSDLEDPNPQHGLDTKAWQALTAPEEAHAILCGLVKPCSVLLGQRVVSTASSVVQFCFKLLFPSTISSTTARITTDTAAAAVERIAIAVLVYKY